ncbi:HepT-like ribonuclease domain-containing protein [Phreatobacter sp.]|uniref:HepT-like ribonuclease domain-containing protein n=1 Tax=Phreatobacter sp. TaxID=1966341 RepID=UPI0022BD5190|nr:HepT-like ribonuclease domain-containing protein [Phreatobacter sp.]MCZ8317160.1 DUF86 domain-containing protein [Phreatobacter sp.]
MPSDRDLSALLDIRDSIMLAIAWTAGHDALSLGDDTKTLYAVVRCLEIISEASRRLSPDVRDRHPDQPWRNIMGSGNIYRHDYDDVAARFVFTTVRNHLPSLLAVVDAEIGGVGA